jgi:hypothetical protein
MCACSVAVAAS